MLEKALKKATEDDSSAELNLSILNIVELIIALRLE
jgi:hypothetical protein